MRSFLALGAPLLLLALMGCSSGSDNGTGSHDGGGTEGGGSSDSGSPSDAGPFDQFQVRNLDDINMYRSMMSIPPLHLDETLCTFALAGSTQETMDHTPHAHFEAASASGQIWKDGFVSSAGENQGDPNGWTLLDATDMTMNELDQIDAIQKAMFDEGPGDGEAHGHYENIMNPAFDRVGVGLVEVMGHLYLTNDFSAD